MTTTTDSRTGPGFIVLYRWRLRAGLEDQFIQAWSSVSRQLREQRGSLGSRLHRGQDGLWYSYAQWPSAAVRAKSASLPPIDPASRKLMQQAVEEELPEVVLESVSDFLVVAGDA
jgi:hypothetical protein